MAYEVIRVRRERTAGIIEFSRPMKLNALSRQLIDETIDALSELSSDRAVGTIILTGSDRAFSTGADLAEAVEIVSTEETMRFNRHLRLLSYNLEHNPKPVIAAISGYCITGGLELAMCCDIRVATEDACFAITSSKIGSVAGFGGTQRLPRLVGVAVAKELFFSARQFDSSEALKIGLVNRVVTNGTAVDVAIDMADSFSRNAPLSHALAKIAVNTGIGMDLESALDLEASLSAQAFSTQDKAEGMRAFLEKRDPVFRGC